MNNRQKIPTKKTNEDGNVLEMINLISDTNFT
jgi:hypothetical protein